MLMVGLFLVISNTTVNAKIINDADTELCDTLKYGLISSLREPVDKALFSNKAFNSCRGAFY